jgi:hypothetical protein
MQLRQGTLTITKAGRGRTIAVNQTFSGGHGAIFTCGHAVGYNGFGWTNSSTA